MVYVPCISWHITQCYGFGCSLFSHTYFLNKYINQLKRIHIMKANELRIGNYFLENGNIKKVNPNVIEQLFESEDRKWIEPIELTEEILLKFGFNTDYKKGYIGKDPEQVCSCDFVLSYPHRMGEWQTYFAWEFDNYKFQKLEYVHELQNLYFALTGSELVFSTEP